MMAEVTEDIIGYTGKCSSFYYQISCGELKECLSSCPLICYVVPSCHFSISSNLGCNRQFHSYNQLQVASEWLTVRGKNVKKYWKYDFPSMGNCAKMI